MSDVMVVRTCDLMWPSRQHHVVSPGHICVVPFTPPEDILVEFTAKWLGAQSLRKTRKRQSGVLVNGRPGKGKSESQSIRKKALKSNWGRERLRRSTDCVLNRKRQRPGVCAGAFLRLYPEGLTSCMNHAQGGASSDKQQTSQSAEAWPGSQECLRTELPSPEGEQGLRLERNNI